MTDDFSQSALVVLAHGSTVNVHSALPARQHASELRRRGIFAEVREAYWKQEPFVRDVMCELKSPRVFVVPLFISEGYFSDDLIPRELGFDDAAPANRTRVQQRDGKTLFYCEPIGTHPGMTNVLLSRAREAIEESRFDPQPPPEETALLIVGHGTEQNVNSRREIEKHAERIRARGLYAETHAVFLEEEPRISDYHRLVSTPNIVVAPFFISDGMHTTEDIPVLLGEKESEIKTRLARGEAAWRNPAERHGKRVWYARSVGSDPQVAEVILQRAREALGQDGDE